MVDTCFGTTCSADADNTLDHQQGGGGVVGE